MHLFLPAVDNALKNNFKRQTNNVSDYFTIQLLSQNLKDICLKKTSFRHLSKLSPCLRHLYHSLALFENPFFVSEINGVILVQAVWEQGQWPYY